MSTVGSWPAHGRTWLDRASKAVRACRRMAQEVYALRFPVRRPLLDLTELERLSICSRNGRLRPGTDACGLHRCASEWCGATSRSGIGVRSFLKADANNEGTLYRHRISKIGATGQSAPPEQTPAAEKHKNEHACGGYDEMVRGEMIVTVGVNVRQNPMYRCVCTNPYRYEKCTPQRKSRRIVK